MKQIKSKTKIDFLSKLETFVNEVKFMSDLNKAIHEIEIKKMAMMKNDNS